jgi:hypothetical protein
MSSTTWSSANIFSRGQKDVDSLAPGERLLFVQLLFDTHRQMDGWDDFFSYDHSLRHLGELQQGLREVGDEQSLEVIEDYLKYLETRGVALQVESINTFLDAQTEEEIAVERDWGSDYERLWSTRYGKIKKYFLGRGIEIQ